MKMVVFAMSMLISLPSFAGTIQKIYKKKNVIMVSTNDSDEDLCCDPGQKIEVFLNDNQDAVPGEIKKIKKNKVFLTIHQEDRAFLRPKMDVEISKPNVTTQTKYLRRKNTFGAGVRYGNFMGGTNGPGLDLTYGLGQNFEATFGYFQGFIDAGSLNDPTIESLDARLDVSYSTIGIRYYTGNSFYITPAIGYRTLDGTFDLRTRPGSGEPDLGLRADFKGTAVTGSIGIGNIWQWTTGIYAGIDWIGLVTPLAHQQTSSTNFYGDDSGSILIDQEFEEIHESNTRLIEDINGSTVGQVLMVNIGYRL